MPCMLNTDFCATVVDYHCLLANVFLCVCGGGVSDVTLNNDLLLTCLSCYLPFAHNQYFPNVSGELSRIID